MRIICILIIACIIIGGCSKEESVKPKVDGSIVGYVVKKEADRFLLVSSEADSNNEYSATWVSTSEEVKIGQLVEVFIEGGEIKASDPGQATSKKIILREIQVGESSSQEASKVLENILLKHTELEVPVVKELAYSKDSKEWSVTLFDKKDAIKKEISLKLKD